MTDELDKYIYYDNIQGPYRFAYDNINNFNVNGFIGFDILSNDNPDIILASTVIFVKFDNYTNYLNDTNLKKYYNYLTQLPNIYPQNGRGFPDDFDKSIENLFIQMPKYSQIMEKFLRTRTPEPKLTQDRLIYKIKFNDASVYVYGFITVRCRTPTDIPNTYRYRKMSIEIDIKNYKIFLNMDNIMNSNFNINTPTKNFFIVYDYFKSDGSVSEITPLYKTTNFMVFVIVCCSSLLLLIVVYFIFK